MTTLWFDQIETPIGCIVLVCDEQSLCALEFADTIEEVRPRLQRRYGQIELTQRTNPHQASDRVRAYFAGDLGAIDAIAVTYGGTAFQQSVWRALRHIPAGRTMSYSQLAEHIGRAQAQRAVGAANGQNPISIVVPCHRLIGASGSLVKYGGGLERKLWLLRHEGANGFSGVH